MDKFLPGRHQIMAFGKGGFRFADMSHQGSLLVLPDRMCAWSPGSVEAMVADDFVDIIAAKEKIDMLLIGTGSGLASLPEPVAGLLRAHGFAFEVMSTSSAVHVFNVVLDEGRRVAAALIAVS